MTPKELKNNILQLAIEGKLVEQRKEEGSAETLYAEIQKEKQKLIKQGKIKREKKLPEITDDEIPFEIPKSWKWVRLGEIGIFERGHGIKRDEIVEEGYPCIRYGQLYTTYKMRCKKIVSHIDYDLYKKMIKAKHDDILMALTGENEYDIALALAYEGKDEVAIGGDMVKFTNIKNFYLYLVYVINSSYGIKCKSELATGKIIVHISSDKLASIKIPLPPYAEQKRIVKKIEELMPLVDKYEVFYDRLNELNKEFPKKLKNAVLQKAIEGKLVPQIKSEGSAEDLYAEIQKEKQKLIKQGKIKKEKKLPKITDDEISFEIPKSWKLIKLNELCDIINGFTPLRTNEKFWKNGSIPWFTVDDIRSQGRIINYTNQKITKDALSKDSNRLLPEDTVLLCCTASVGEYAITKIPLTTNQQFNGLVIKEYWKKYFSSDFLLLLVQTFKDRLINVAGKTTFNFISVKKLGDFVIPFLPLAEQKRIVEKIEEILPNIEKLEKILYKW